MATWIITASTSDQASTDNEARRIFPAYQRRIRRLSVGLLVAINLPLVAVAAGGNDVRLRGPRRL